MKTPEESEFRCWLLKVRTEDQRHRYPSVLARSANSQAPLHPLSQNLHFTRFVRHDFFKCHPHHSMCLLEFLFLMKGLTF